MLSEAPTHVAIIMDGNGRWAKAKGLLRTQGHRSGADALKRTVEAACKLGVQVLSVYAFSTENWKRPKVEVTFLMQLLKNFIYEATEKLHKNQIKICFLGDKKALSKSLQTKIKKAEAKTQNNQKFILNILLNYGGRAEILEAARSICSKVQKGTLSLDTLTEEIFSQNLYTANLPDPQLLIRTGGECRLSNFLLWQISYTDIYFTDIYWPDFSETALQKALIWYQERQRRFGGVHT